MVDGKLKTRDGANLPKVTQLVGLRSQALPLNTHFAVFSES